MFLTRTVLITYMCIFIKILKHILLFEIGQNTKKLCLTLKFFVFEKCESAVMLCSKVLKILVQFKKYAMSCGSIGTGNKVTLAFSEYYWFTKPHHPISQNLSSEPTVRMVIDLRAHLFWSARFLRLQFFF